MSHYGPARSSRSRSPRGRNKGRSNGDGKKYTCRFIIGIENEDQFRVVRRIIGAGGSQMKDIVARSGGDAKLRMRGKGSGFLERDSSEESPEPLQLCISSITQQGYHVAVKGAERLLVSVYDEYKEWCANNDRPTPELRLQMTERHFHSKADQQSCADEGSSKRRGRVRERGRDSSVDRGVPPPNAPSSDEIEDAIEARNGARRSNDFREADRIRDDLKDKGVVLSDEKGGHGNAGKVTSWRYWNE